MSLFYILIGYISLPDQLSLSIVVTTYFLYFGHCYAKTGDIFIIETLKMRIFLKESGDLIWT